MSGYVLIESCDTLKSTPPLLMPSSQIDKNPQSISVILIETQSQVIFLLTRLVIASL